MPEKPRGKILFDAVWKSKYNDGSKFLGAVNADGWTKN